MVNRNFLIATNTLAIGGCETYVVTMARELKENGYGVTVVANDGIFKSHLESIGVKVYILNFFERLKHIENISVIQDIIREQEITDVCINPFYPFFEVVAACIKENVNYDLFFHGVSLKGYFDIKDSFSVLGIWSNIYIKDIATKYARSFVYVSEEVKEFYEKEFNLEKSKGIILKNSVKVEVKIDEVNKIKRFVMLSRIDNDKLDSIKCAIQLYKSIYDKSINKEEMCFDIVGMGNKLLELEQIVKECEEYNIKILEQTENPAYVMKNYDAVIGMGRTIIEAMSLKKIAILVTYNNYIGMINAKDVNEIEKIAYANFSGRNMLPNSIENGAKDILELNHEQINEIVNENYKYILNNNNIKTNVLDYINKTKEKTNILKDMQEELNEHLKIIQYIDNLEKNNKDYEENLKIILENNATQKKELNYKEDKINQLIKTVEDNNKEIEYYKQQSQANRNEADYYKNMLNNIYNKRGYKIYRAIKNIFTSKK